VSGCFAQVRLKRGSSAMTTIPARMAAALLLGLLGLASPSSSIEPPPRRHEEATILGQARCGDLGLVVMSQVRTRESENPRSPVERDVLEVLWLDPVVEEQSRVLWRSERRRSVTHMGPPIYSALIECDMATPAAEILLLVRHALNAHGSLIQVPLPSLGG